MRIIIFNEKHGDQAFIADTDEQLNAACLLVLRQRYAQGWFDEPIEPTVSDVDQVIIDANLDGKSDEVDQRLAEIRDKIKRQRRRYDEALDEWNNIKKLCELPIAEALALKAPDGRYGGLAFDVLYERADFQYEGFDIIDATNALHELLAEATTS